jgi:hypothetical protein
MSSRLYPRPSGVQRPGGTFVAVPSGHFASSLYRRARTASGPEGSGVVGKRSNYAQGTRAVQIAPVLAIPRRRESVKKVPFVSTANTCRSPMAQATFDSLTEDERFPFRAESAATKALEGTNIADNAVVALEEAEIYPGLHSARW